jgi:hypothetical protein
MSAMSTLNFSSDQTSTKEITSQRYDLHTHTYFSDGQLSPQELIDRAVNFQVDCIAITDHDTTAALDIAAGYILEKNYPIKLINGVEISTQWHGFDIHVVGLAINPAQVSIKQLLLTQQQCRMTRAQQIAAKLEKAGFADIYQQAKSYTSTDIITRAHFARALTERGVVSQPQQAFNKYLGKGKRAYVAPQWCTITQAVSAIHDAGGVAVLAHPIRYDLTAKWRRRLIVDFKSANGDALEAALPQMNENQRRLITQYCLEYNLLASVGSDFHYPTRWSDLGRRLTIADQLTPVWSCW